MTSTVKTEPPRTKQMSWKAVTDRHNQGLPVNKELDVYPFGGRIFNERQPGPQYRGD